MPVYLCLLFVLDVLWNIVDYSCRWNVFVSVNSSEFCTRFLNIRRNLQDVKIAILTKYIHLKDVTNRNSYYLLHTVNITNFDVKYYIVQIMLIPNNPRIQAGPSETTHTQSNSIEEFHGSLEFYSLAALLHIHQCNCEYDIIVINCCNKIENAKVEIQKL